MADSAQCFYELFVRRLDRPSARRCGRTTSASASCSGCRAPGRPQTYDEFRTWYAAELASDEMYLTDEARYIGYATAFEIPLPACSSPASASTTLSMLGSLPPRVRELYGLPYGRAQQTAFTASASAMRAARRLTPQPLRPRLRTRGRSSSWPAPSAGGSSTADRRRR